MQASAGSQDDEVRSIELGIPIDLRYQLLFRQRRMRPFEVAPLADVEYHLCRNLAGFLKVARPLWRIVGGLELLKSLARMVVGRMFYYVRRGDELLHTGWVNIGFCRHYVVGRSDVVIGPIWSAAAGRGLGLATFATMRTINELVALGYSTFYIDTNDDNLACQKVIAKCGFSTPIGSYPRKPDAT